MGEWSIKYTWTDTSNITTSCGSPVYGAAGLNYNTTTQDGSFYDYPWPNYNNLTGTATCTATAKNSIGETVNFIFQLRQIRNTCILC